MNLGQEVLLIVYKKGLKPIIYREFIMFERFTTVEAIIEKVV